MLEKIRMNFNSDRFKNPYFWVGIIGVILTACNIDPSTLTTWHAVYVKLVEIVSNPYLMGSIVMALLGVFVDPNTKGITDCKF